MNYKELHFEGIKLSKELKKCETRLIEILGFINDNKIFLRYGETNIYSYAEKYFDFSYRKTCTFLALYSNSKKIPLLKEEIKKGETPYSKLSTILPALQKKNEENTDQSKREIKTLLEITKSTPRRKLEVIAKDIAPLADAFKDSPPPKYLGKGKIELTARLSKEEYILLEKAMDLMSGEISEKVDFHSFIKIVSKKVIENKLKKGKKSALIVVDRINEKEMVETKSFGELEIKKDKFETGGIALRQKRNALISQKTKDYVYKRDGGKCVCCSNVHKLSYHHITPVSENGSNHATNIILVCKSCHNLIHTSQIMVFNQDKKLKFKYKNPMVKTFTDYLYERKKEEYLNFKRNNFKPSEKVPELNLFS
jgi:hypothetical protein